MYLLLFYSKNIWFAKLSVIAGQLWPFTLFHFWVWKLHTIFHSSNSGTSKRYANNRTMQCSAFYLMKCWMSEISVYCSLSELFSVYQNEEVTVWFVTLFNVCVYTASFVHSHPQYCNRCKSLKYVKPWVNKSKTRGDIYHYCDVGGPTLNILKPCLLRGLMPGEWTILLSLDLRCVSPISVPPHLPLRLCCYSTL